MELAVARSSALDRGGGWSFAPAVICLAILLIGCGKEGPPLPPKIRVAERTTDLKAFQEGDTAVLSWSYPSMTTAGEALTDVEWIEVWRAALPLGQEPPAPLTAQDRKLQGQLLQTQGEVIQALDPAELAAATRGSNLIFRDDLGRWRDGIDGDPGEMVVWYGVRTICCRKRESDLSNVARLLPARPPEPPDDVQLTAGALGIDVRWRENPSLSVLVERSDDGERWSRVTEEPVTGGLWRDEQVAQGRAWSYRLRSVAAIEGGGRVIGDASEPVRVEHPDTYPPDTPEEVVCLPEGAQVRLRWRSVPGAATYEVTRRGADGSTSVLETGVAAVELTDPDPPLGEIVYNVVARDAVGNTSEPASCTVVMGVVP